MSPREVAARFAVDPKTVSRWANEGKLPYFRTPGGHRRFLRSAVELLTGEQDTPAAGENAA